jgi:hypothetical protein
MSCDLSGRPGSVRIYSNDKAAIKKWLKTLPEPVDLAIESTNINHLAFSEIGFLLMD